MQIPSLPVRGAWIEMMYSSSMVRTSVSLLVRGAWIEIKWETANLAARTVAPRAGSVD